jgi:hypothetical protein
VTNLPLTEAQWQCKVVDYAKHCQWRRFHQPVSQVGGRYMTATQGNIGFPDWVFARRGVVLFVELKTQKGNPTIEQDDWLREIGPHARLWRPSDWPIVVSELALSRPRLVA